MPINDKGIECPYCSYLHTEEESWDGAVTYWGSDGDTVPKTCEHCEKDFEVKEIVERYWETEQPTK